MTATTARAEADEATRDAMVSVQKHGSTWSEAAYLVLRTAAIEHAYMRGGLATAEKLRALADEIGGGA